MARPRKGTYIPKPQKVHLAATEYAREGSLLIQTNCKRVLDPLVWPVTKEVALVTCSNCVSQRRPGTKNRKSPEIQEFRSEND